MPKRIKDEIKKIFLYDYNDLLAWWSKKTGYSNVEDVNDALELMTQTCNSLFAPYLNERYSITVTDSSRLVDARQQKIFDLVNLGGEEAMFSLKQTIADYNALVNLINTELANYNY